jgi:hypothetical protein
MLFLTSDARPPAIRACMRLMGCRRMISEYPHPEQFKACACQTGVLLAATRRQLLSSLAALGRRSRTPRRANSPARCAYRRRQTGQRLAMATPSRRYPMDDAQLVDSVISQLSAACCDDFSSSAVAVVNGSMQFQLSRRRSRLN